MGRGKKCKEIMSHLSSESTRIVSIFGPAGFGKSQVAIAVGNDLKIQGEKVYHLELRRAQNKKELISKFLCNFNVSPNCRDLEPEDSLSYQLSQVNEHLYFILDNADRLLEPNEKDDVINLIKDILTKFSNVTLIVTTRELPKFSHLESLGQILIRVGKLGMFYCKNLVEKLLPDSNDDEREKIAQLCGYMPFAIILLCRSITQSKKPLNEALDFIRSTKKIVRELDDPDDTSDSTLIGIFSSSFESLPQYDKEAFVTLSVIPGSFDVDVATAVLGKYKSEAEMTLKRLQRRSFIDSRSGSYQLHKLLQEFGSEKGENEMNEVFRNAKTRFEEYYISKFIMLNETFLAAKLKSMSTFIAFFKDKDRFVSSLMEGCTESGTTSDRAFDALMNAELFLDTLLWSDRTTFNMIYDSALKEAQQRGNDTVYQQLVVAKAFSEVTWRTAKGETMQTLSSDRGKPIEGKRACYLGIHKLVTGKLKEGVKLLKDALSHLDGTKGQFLILKVVACQILSMYYESENRLQRATEFLKKASEECNKIGDPSLLVIPQLNKTLKKEEKASENRPLSLEMYFLISKAIKIFSPAETMKSLEQDVLRMENEIYRKPSTNINKVVAIFHFHRSVVGVLAEMNKFKEAIQSIQATIDLQIEVIKQCTHDGVGSQGTENKDDVIEDLQLQEHNETLAKSYSYLSVLKFRVKDYRASFESQRCALEIRRKIFGEQHASTVDSYHELAIILRTMGDCFSALHFQKDVLAFRLNLSDQNPSKTADSYHELGVTQCKAGDFAAALCSHERALHIRLEHLGNRHQDTASSYYELGISQWCMEKYECALDYHEKALSIALDVLGELDTVTADSYYERGKTYLCLEDYRASLRSHEHARSTRSELLGDDHPDTAKSNHELGVTHYAIEQYPSALWYLKCALAARQKIHGAQHEDVVQSYHQLARTQYKLQDYTQAFQSYNSAVSIRKRLLEENHSKTADSFYGLGILPLSNQDCPSAFVKQQNALTNGKENLDEEDAKRADSLYHMANVQRKLQNYELSLQLHQCALDIRLKLSGQNHTAKTAESYYQLGLVLCDLARYDEAFNSHQKALEIRLELLGYSHGTTADSYLQISNIQLKRMVLDSALESLQHAVQITTELLAKQNQQLAHCSLDQQVNEKFLQDDASGLQLFKHASTVSQEFSACVSSKNHSLSNQLENLEIQLIEKANSYRKLGIAKLEKMRSELDDVTPALHLHQHALEINRELFGETHPHTADSYQTLGSSQLKIKDLRSALQSHQRALDIRLQLFGVKHEKTADSYHELGDTQWKMNDLTSALQSHQRALDTRLELFGVKHEKTAASYRKLGKRQKFKVKTSKIQSRQRALDSTLEPFGEKHEKAAASYRKLGKRQKFKVKTSKIQSRQRALDSTLEPFGEKHEKTADSYHSLGITQWETKDFTSALQSHKRALDIRRKLFGEEHEKTADSYFSLGVSQYR